ncbi:hypothetical protein QAD02_022979 [Eretmocerus hayati]|uniref:Uncharacterized protein n=1 Tax=Eretmocerus hayati TaxID=131215 RepID=A0ACC2PUS5_9HYME|nr:hypothetical protein QAD02_022979 [Eretmocerus hayati]
MNSRPVIINRQQFHPIDCGGRGACLFKCLCPNVSNTDHYRTRRSIVNHVIINWARYKLWVNLVLQIKNPEDYRRVMSMSKTYGSEIEVRAASELYSVDISLVRRLKNREDFVVDFSSGDNSIPQRDRIYLLFTGMEESNDLDGHYQILQRLSHNRQENSEVQDVRVGEGHSQHIIDSAVYESDGDNSGPDAVSSDKKRKVFTKDFKEKIVSTRMTLEGSDERVRKVVELTANCLQISKKSVKRVSREFRNNGGYVEAPKNHLAGRKAVQIDPFFQSAIRRSMFDAYSRKEYPTAENILQTMLDSFPDFPDLSAYQIRKCMKSMGFRYGKFVKKPILMESPSMVAKRMNYLMLKKLLKEQGFKDKTHAPNEVSLQPLWNAI